MTAPTLAQMRRNMPHAEFEAVAAGTLPRNHIGYGVTADGHPYRHAQSSGKGWRLTVVSYEPAEAQP